MRRFLPHILALLFLLSVAAATCLAQGSASSKKTRKAELEKEIEMLDRQLKDNASRSASALSKLTLTRKKVQARKALIMESDAMIAELADSIEAGQNGIAALRSRLDTLSQRYSGMVRAAYMVRDPYKVWMYVLSSGDIAQAGRRYAYFRSISAALNGSAAETMELRDTLEARMKALEGLKTDAEILRTARKAEYRTLAREENEEAKVVSQLKRDKSKYQKQIAAKKRQVEALNKEISRIVSSQAAKTRTGSSDPAAVKLSGEFASNRGKLPWPAEGVIVDHFGEHYHPVYKTVKMPFNNGVTFSVATGTKVRCVFDGTVRQVIVMPGYNQCVLVQHGRYFTFYCKLGSVAVKAGDNVRTGSQIGTVDTIAGETQVHFELWDGKDPQDPEDWLR